MATGESIGDELASTCFLTKIIPRLAPVPIRPKAIEKPASSDEAIEGPADSDKTIEELAGSDTTTEGHTWTSSVEEDDDKCSVDSWGEPLSPPEPSKNDDDDDDDDTDGIPTLEEIDQGIRKNWENREAPGQYTEVIVLLIRWEKHDLGQKLAETVEHYRYMFECLYGYEVWDFKIPAKKPHLALTSILIELAKRDSPETLFLIWYDGHGREHMDRRGSPSWCSHHDST